LVMTQNHARRVFGDQYGLSERVQVLGTGAQQQVGQAVAPSRFPPGRFRISMNEMTTYRWSFLEDVLYYQEMAIDAMGVWLRKLEDFGEERGIDLLMESGIKVTSVSWAGGFTGTNGHLFREAIQEAHEAIELSGQMEADCLVILSGPRNSHTKNHMRRLLVDGLRQLADDAVENDIVLAVKPMHRLFAREWTFLNTLDQTLDVLDEVDHPAVGMAFDAYHLWQEPRLADRIAQIVPYVATVQLSDWRKSPRSDNDHCLPGTGDVPLERIIHAFLENGYDRHFDVQVWSQELWRSDYFQLLRDCKTYLLSLGTNLRRHIPA